MANCGIGEATGTWAAQRAPLLACDRPFVTIASSTHRHHPVTWKLLGRRMQPHRI
jgi:hypothetical protein